jgi:lactoylglutathione lyase
MTADPKATNVKEIVPFLWVTSMERSIRYYMDGVGFTMKHQWTPDGKLRWCWLTLGGASLMLQEFWTDGHHEGRPEGKLGQGLSLCFTCQDAIAIYREVTSRGIEASEPQVGNNMWVTGLTDPDGYRLFFESATDVPEETKLSEVKNLRSE